MSEKDFKVFDDDVMTNLEKLKAKYSDYGVDDEAIEKINKNIQRSDPDYNAFEEDFSGGFEEEDSVEDIYSGKDDTETVPFISASDNERDIYSSYDDEPEYEETPDLQEGIRKYEEDTQPDDSSRYFTQDENVQPKKKKKKKSHKALTTVLIIGIIAVIWGALFSIDYIYVSNWNDPMFCAKTAEYENGSRDFTGAFYKFQYHVENNGDITSVCLPWFVKGPNDNLKKKDEKPEAKETAKTGNNTASADNDKKLKITVPGDFIDEDPDKELELTDEQKSQGYNSLVKNKDGSVTYEIGSADYINAVASLKESVAKNLNGLVTDTDYPSIKKAEFNDDFSSVTLYVDKAIYTTGLDSFASVSVYNWVGYYQAFAQKEQKCDLVIKDFADNTVIESKG